MSKELENIKHYDSRVGLHENDYTILEKSLKALEIIKKKSVDVYYFTKQIPTLERYNLYIENEDRKLTLDEYDLLKEELLWKQFY